MTAIRNVENKEVKKVLDKSLHNSYNRLPNDNKEIIRDQVMDGEDIDNNLFPK